MSTTLTRTFHPVGQGAFYSEVICNEDGKKFTVVYDCGSGNGTTVPQRIKDAIERWEHKSDIDILFISHFHNDHINGVKQLISKAKVVVMPYLSPCIITALDTLKSHLEETGFEPTFSIINPKNHPNKKFLYVVSETENLQTITSQDIFDESPNKGCTAYIRTGDSIKATPFWFYRPFTREVSSTNQNLLAAIEHLNNAIAKYKKENIWNERNIAEIKRMYKTLDKDLNKTSMLLFSSSCSPSIHDESKFPQYPSCLYTGDMYLTDDIWQLINKTVNNYKIGTIQMPHHGSKHGWIAKCQNRILKSDILYFCSHDLNNRYNHPHIEVCNDFNNNNILFYDVTQNPSSKIENKFTI